LINGWSQKNDFFLPAVAKNAFWSVYIYRRYFLGSQEVTTVDDETRQRLLEADWDVVWARAIKQATVETKILEAMGFALLDPQDLVNEAVLRLFNGSRAWDYERYPDLATHLTWVIWSIASHVREQHLSQISLNLDDDNKKNGEDPEKWDRTQRAAALSAWAPKIQSPEELAILNERLMWLRKQLTTLSENDEEIGFLFECLLDGIDEPREVAKTLGWDVRKVNNARKRMMRQLGTEAVAAMVEE
jgi:hypothetical protein